METWAGYVFVHFDPDAEPLLGYLEPIPEMARVFRLDEMRLVSQMTFPIEANWKTGIEAFLEVYHVPATHFTNASYFDDTIVKPQVLGLHGRLAAAEPNAADIQFRPSSRLGLGDDFDPQEVLRSLLQDYADNKLYGSQDADVAEQMAQLQVPPGMPVGRFLALITRQGMEAEGMDTSTWTDDDLVCNQLYFFFPNFVGPFVPRNMLQFRFRPHATDPDWSFVDVFVLQRFGPGVEPPPVTRETLAKWSDHGLGETLSQDLWNLERIQAGMHSRGFKGGRLGAAETIITQFHRNLSRIMLP